MKNVILLIPLNLYLDEVQFLFFNYQLNVCMAECIIYKLLGIKMILNTLLNYDQWLNRKKMKVMNKYLKSDSLPHDEGNNFPC